MLYLWTMKKVLPAEEFILNYEQEFYQGPVYSSSGYPYSEVVKALTDFAKAHVKAALEAASQKANYSGGGTWKTNDGPLESTPIRIDKNSILNAYPETEIE